MNIGSNEKHTKDCLCFTCGYSRGEKEFKFDKKEFKLMIKLLKEANTMSSVELLEKLIKIK